MAAHPAVSRPLGFVADVGGTNARFAEVRRGADGRPQIGAKTTLATADFPTFEAAARHWLATLAVRPRAASLAFAGPIDGDDVALTNRAWSFGISDLQRVLKLDTLRVINDFAAIAYSLPLIEAPGWCPLPGPAWPRILPRMITVLGPGTGLGVSMLLSTDSGHLVIATEGGHTGFAPSDAVEIELLRCLSLRYGRVSCERLISGSGLQRLHQALAALQGATFAERDPADIVAAARQGDDPLCVAAVERFCLILATIAGDLALAQGADAVAIAGGIPPKLLDFLGRQGFRDRFNAKGRSQKRMESIPLAVIVEEDPGLLGAAAVLSAHVP